MSCKNSLTSNIRGSSVDRFKDCGALADVPGRSDAKTADETSAEIRENVTVQVWHDQHVKVGGILKAECPTSNSQNILILITLLMILQLK